MSRPVAIVDIDGVVADVRHRVRHVEQKPKNWKAFFAEAKNDLPHREGVEMVQRLQRDHDIVYLSGRPVHLKDDTLAWLDLNGIGGHELIMRRDDDRRPAALVKVDFLRKLSKTRSISIVIDDDARVIKAVTAAGFEALHATWENRNAKMQSSLFEAQEGEGRT